MKVLIDATASPGPTGVGVYGRHLIDEMLELDSGIEFLLLFMGNVSRAPERWRRNATVVGTDRSWVRGLVCGLGCVLPGLWPPWWPRDFDVYHSLELFVPRIWRGKSVLGVMHVTHERGFKAWCHAKSVAQAHRIIAISASTKNEILKEWNRPEDSISVIHLAPPKHELAGDLKDADLPAGVSEPYILYVGGLSQKGRNVRGLARAYASLRKEHRLPHMLVLIGQIEVGFERCFKAIVEAADGEPVIHAGYVPEETKLALYRRAEMLVVPSLAEGFGIPIVEAMANGCPVVSSTAGACPEICGGAALLVDPRDEKAMAEAMLKIIRDPALRRDLIEKGRERAAHFSWERAARETIEVYREVAEG